VAIAMIDLGQVTFVKVPRKCHGLEAAWAATPPRATVTYPGKLSVIERRGTVDEMAIAVGYS